MFMIAAGLLAAVIIVFSQSYYQQTNLIQKKNSDSKTTSEETVISAPSDAVTSNSLVKLSENITPEVQPSFSTQESKSILKVESRIFIKYFRTLFQAIISPNAP